MKIVILDGHVANPGDLSWEGLEQLGSLTVYDRTPAERVIERIGGAEIILTNKTVISAEVLDACPNVRYIGELATGYNNVDVDAAAARGIPVCNIPAYSTDAVAQMVIALLLEICNRVGEHNDAVQAGEWSSCPDFSFWKHPLIELAGKTMGIIGYGNIGRATEKIAAALGMKVIVYSRHAKIPNAVPLDELYEKSDVISLHSMLTEDTEKMINKDSIARMKKGVIIINTARGGLVDEAALADALKTGQVGAAGLDVVSAEPIAADNPLLKVPNCYITPHIAWAPKESRARLVDIAVGNVKAFIEGKPVNVVNGV